MTPEKTVLLIALKSVSTAFDEFVGACMKDGKPVAPPIGELMKARGYLPPYCNNAFKVKNG